MTVIIEEDNSEIVVEQTTNDVNIEQTVNNIDIEQTDNSVEVTEEVSQIVVQSPGPQGVKGETALTFEVGDTTTLEPGSPATVENVGTDADIVLDFGIPQGEKGDKGDKGDTGERGLQGEQGDPGPTIYPSAGIAVSTGTEWDTSITDNSTDWNTAYGWGNHAGLYEPISTCFKLDQSGTPQTVSGGSPIFQDGITFFASNQFTLTQDGVNTIADVDGGYYKLTSPYRQESGTFLFIDAAPFRFFAGHQESITQNDDLFTGANNESVLDIGMDVSKYSGGATDNYGTGCLDGKTAHRFYCDNQRTYQNGSIQAFTAGVYGAVGLNCNIASAGAILSTRNMAFYSDIHFLGKETSGTHNAQNFLFSGLLETEGHEVINGTVLNAVLYADNDGFIVEETDETHMILDLSSYPWTKRADNSKIIMGAGDDFETYWNGTDQILDPHTVGGGGVKIITGNDTSIETDELSIDLSVFVPDLVITTPVLKATANSTLPEVIPFPYALGVYDRFAVFAQGTFDNPEVLFAYNDFSSSASIGADLTNGYCWVNWNWCPEEDDAYSLGLSTLTWQGLWSSADVNIVSDTYGLKLGAGADMLVYYDGTVGHIKTNPVATSDLDVTCGSQKTIRLVNTVWEDVQFNVESGRVAAANFPDWDASFTTNTGCFKFDVDDYIDLGTNEMPHWWKQGTTVKPHIHVALDGANTSGSSQYAKFTLYIAYADEGDVYTETSATGEIEIPTGSADLKQFFVSLTDLALTGKNIGTQVNLRLKRIAATTGTEYPNHIFATQVGIHAEADTIGSRQVRTK